jgi:hypothetical protein
MCPQLDSGPAQAEDDLQPRSVVNSRNGNGGTGEKPGHPVERIAHELYAYVYPLVLMDVTGRSWAMQKGLRALSRLFINLSTWVRPNADML